MMNNWNVSYATIKFFERALGGHDKVQGFQRTKDIHFAIKHVDERTLTVLLVDEYVIGVAALLRAKEEFPDIEYVVTGGNWNGYTREAKEYGLANGIGVFNVEEFLGALTWKRPKEYVQKDKDGNAIYHYKRA